MKPIQCSSCNTEISPAATTCPKCGHPNEKRKLTKGQTIGVLIAGTLFVAYFFGGGIENQAASSMEKIQSQVANDAVAQYKIAAKQGDPIQTCVAASFVAAAYLQAKDEKSYEQWKKQEDTDCKKSGQK
jgi:ribosomal protein L40E